MVADNPNCPPPARLEVINKYKTDMASINMILMNIQFIMSTKQYGMLRHVEKMLTDFLDKKEATSTASVVTKREETLRTLDDAMAALNKAYKMSDKSRPLFSIKSIFKRRK